MKKVRVNMMVASKADKKEAKELVLQDFIRFSLRAARGLGNIAEEEGKELVRRMVEINRISPEEGDKLLETLMLRMKASKEIFEKRVEESVSKAVEKLSSISSREIETIKGRIESIDQRIRNLVSKKNFRAEV